MMDKAKLINWDFPIEFVIFNINPNSVSMQKTVQMRTQGSSQPTAAATVPGFTQPQNQSSDPRKISLKNLFIEGLTCKMTADMMISWMTPFGSYLQQVLKMVGAMATPRANPNPKPPTLMFQWGPPLLGFVMKCNLTALNLDFQRFSPLGTPTRAKITSLELTEVWDETLYMLTNPTSGGKPGRTAHTVTDGQSLQHLSVERYGKPQYWRGLAEANDIDDPMRVRAGDRVYLPPMDEVIVPSTGR